MSLAPPEGPEEPPQPETVVGVSWNGQPVHYQDLRPGSDLRWVTFLSDLEHHWRGAPFRGTLLGGAVLRGLDGRVADFTDCDLCHADLEGTRLEGAKFDRAQVGEAQARMLERQGADLRRARILREVPDPAPTRLEGKGVETPALDLVNRSGLSLVQIGRLAFPGWKPESRRSRIHQELTRQCRFLEGNRTLFAQALGTLLGPEGRNGVTADQILAILYPETRRNQRTAGAAPAGDWCSTRT